VDDLARDEQVLLGKLLPGFVSVFDGSVDAVAEAELLSEVEREVAGCEREVLRAHAIDERAGVIAAHLAADDLLQAESLVGIPGVAHETIVGNGIGDTPL
jgi:hypothetical protein